MRNADLIIGHGGAGTVMESLSFNKPLVVVVNNRLLHNHQTELAERLALDKHCLIAYSPDQLISILEDPNLLSPKPFGQSTSHSVFTDYLDRIMNFEVK
jgi:beta-1,4-N-acetylglucosaminyltransferase